MAANDGAGAIAAYQAGVKAAPGEPQVAAELAYLYERLGRIDDAIGLYESMYRRDPRAQAVANNLAMLLVNYRKDKASLDRARDLTAGFTASNDGTLLDTNGWVHFKRAEYDEALPVLQRAAEQAPQSREIRCHLGLAEWRVGHSDQARTDLEAGLAGKDSFAGADEARTALAQLTGRAS
jgi:Flp pilus assembly protein TadD